MATADHNQEVLLTSDAMDAIDCFTDGMDGVVCDLAGQIASARESSEEGIVVTVDDIASATQIIGKAISDSDIPEHIKTSIEKMLDCCSRRIRRSA